MNIVTQKAKKRQRIIEYSLKHGKSEASRKYKEPLSNIKRWSKRYDGTWQSLKDKSGQPHSHPKQHTLQKESLILEVWNEHGRKGIDYVYCVLIQEKGYTRSQGGLFHALRRLGLIEKPKKKGRRNYRQCTPCEIPGEKVQMDVKVVPDYCITISDWCKKFAPIFHSKMLTLMPLMNFDSDEWHADETVVKISGKKYYVWFIIDSETRFVLGFHLSPHRDSPQAFSLFDSVKQYGKPNAIVTDRYLIYLFQNNRLKFLYLPTAFHGLYKNFP